MEELIKQNVSTVLDALGELQASLTTAYNTDIGQEAFKNSLPLLLQLNQVVTLTLSPWQTIDRSKSQLDSLRQAVALPVPPVPLPPEPKP